MGGKSKGGGSSAPLPQIKETQFDVDPSHYRNIGYQATPSPFTDQGKPQWMQGYFDMPTWGRAAADPSVRLTQEMLSPGGQYALNAALAERNPQLAQSLPTSAPTRPEIQAPQQPVQAPSPTGKAAMLAQMQPQQQQPWNANMNQGG